MVLIDSYTALAQDVKTRLEDNASALGLKAVYYGDQERIPYTPTAAIEPGGKERRLNGMPRRTEVSLTCYIIVYHYSLASTQDIRLENDTLAEDIETFLHEDCQLKDTNGEMTVIDSMVPNIESGIMVKRNTLFRASRITFEARSQVQLPYAP